MAGFRKASKPSKPSSGDDENGSQQQKQRSDRPPFSTGVGQRGPWARINGGLPSGNGGTTVFLFPSKKDGFFDASAQSWSRDPNKRSLKFSVKAEDISYLEDKGYVKIPATIRIRLDSKNADKMGKLIEEGFQSSSSGNGNGDEE